MSDIRDLITETKKQLEHLRVLGVEGIRETKITRPPIVLEQSASSASLLPDLAPETFEQIHSEIGNCTRCPLYQERTHVVHTEGNRKARLMFVGEAPGADEDIQARPFVGRAGQL